MELAVNQTKVQAIAGAKLMAFAMSGKRQMRVAPGVVLDAAPEFQL
jgi:hypothetical protein